MIYLIIGGSKSGKSIFSQKIAKKIANPDHLWYLATMEPRDDEDFARIERHISEREGWGFKTVEWGRSINQYINEIDCEGTYLVDSITTLLSNEMFSSMNNNNIDRDSYIRITNDLRILSEKAKNIVFVSDNIFCDGYVFDESTEYFRKGLSYICKSISKYSDSVIEFVCGNPIYYKGDIDI